MLKTNPQNTTKQINTYTISARGKLIQEPITSFIDKNFGSVPIEKIESVFGFVEQSSLYGGRAFYVPQLSNENVLELNSMGIGLRIPFTNHFANEEEYQNNKKLLSNYHHPLNSIICTNDNLASWIKRDFPDYDIEASVIKNFSNIEQIDEALEIYNTLVLPMSANDDDKLLNSIVDKSRIRLFANAGCAYTCPAKICYKSFSKFNKKGQGEMKCSQIIKERQMKGLIDFDIEKLANMGFHKFKLLRGRAGNQTGY